MKTSETIQPTEEITLLVTAKARLEPLVRQELAALGFADCREENGRLAVPATVADIPKLNLWLRCAARVLLKTADFRATTFDDLFEQTKAVPWERWIPPDGKFTVRAKTVRSAIRSARSSQSIVKKAIVERLKMAYEQDWFAETGAEFTVHVSVLRDVATLSIDTSGAGLHKRGYRADAGEAPLKETLAAALVMLSGWQPDQLLLDPLCGSGTILIEAALLGRNIAPGLDRTFAAEAWPTLPQSIWQAARREAQAAIRFGDPLQLQGSDRDGQVVATAKQNALEAGVADDITFVQKRVKDVWIDQQFGVMISNPPYGMRLGEFKEINQLYITLNKMFRKKTGWSVCVLTADSKFPNYFKRSRPSRVRRLYNGNIEANFYQYEADGQQRKR